MGYAGGGGGGSCSTWVERKRVVGLKKVLELGLCVQRGEEDKKVFVL